MAEAWTVGRYAVIDVEGNGQRPPDLVELAIVPIDNGQVGQPRCWLVRPIRPITWQARKIHGITNDDVRDQPAAADIADQIRPHLSGRTVVGHNVRIDLDVINRTLPGWQPTLVIDTLRLARTLHPDLPSHRLGALAEHLQLATHLPPGLQPHRASYDALVTAHLFTTLAAHPDGTHRTLAELTNHPVPPAVASSPQEALW